MALLDFSFLNNASSGVANTPQASGLPPGAPGSDPAALKEQWKQYLQQQIDAIKTQGQNATPTKPPSGQPNPKKLGLAALGVVIANALGDKKGEFGKALVPALQEAEAATQGAQYQGQESERLANLTKAQADERMAVIGAQEVGRQLQELQQIAVKDADRKVREQAIIERTFGNTDLPADLIRGSLVAQGVTITPEMEEQFNAIATRQKAKLASDQDLKQRAIVQREITSALSVWGSSTDPQVRQAAAAQFVRAMQQYPDEVPPEYQAHIPKIIEEAKLATPKQKNEEARTSKTKAEIEAVKSRAKLTDSQKALVDKKVETYDEEFKLRAANVHSLIAKRAEDSAKSGGKEDRASQNAQIADLQKLISIARAQLAKLPKSDSMFSVDWRRSELERDIQIAQEGIQKIINARSGLEGKIGEVKVKPPKPKSGKAGERPVKVTFPKEGLPSGWKYSG